MANTGNSTNLKATAGPISNPFPYSLPLQPTQTFSGALLPILVTEYDPSGRFRVPVTYDYNLTVEHQVMKDVAVRIAYVGSMSRHQFVNLELNPVVNTAQSATLTDNQRRPYNTAPVAGPCASAVGCATEFTNIVEASMSGSASYNSLQTTVEKKMSHGLSVLANYTWSKAMDDLPYVLGVSNDENLNAGESYVYPIYPANTTGLTPGSVVPDERRWI